MNGRKESELKVTFKFLTVRTQYASFSWHGIISSSPSFCSSLLSLAEVLGAVVSVQIIWMLTGILVYEAILRCIHQDFEIDANIMLITASGGLIVNVL